VATSVFSDTSNASIKWEGFAINSAGAYNAAQYNIEFFPDTTIIVYNLNKQSTYMYNANALTDGEGFAIVSRNNINNAYPNAKYRSNEFITFDSIFVAIKNDTNVTNPAQISMPSPRAIFKVQTYDVQQYGDQIGLDYFYEDTELTNGRTYVYAVTAFDRGDPKINLPSLESAIPENKITVVPRATPVDRTVETLSNVKKVSGSGNGNVQISIEYPLQMVKSDFRVEFFGEDSIGKTASYLRIVNTSVDTVVFDSLQIVNGSVAASFYGLNFTATAEAHAEVDTNNSVWTTGSSSYNFTYITSVKSQPFDYKITFTDDPSGDPSTFTGDTLVFPTAGNRIAPFNVWNSSLNKQAEISILLNLNGGFITGKRLLILREERTGNFDASVEVRPAFSDTTDPIQAGDVFEVKMIRPFMQDDIYTFSTTAFNDSKSEYSLNNVKVVPNPFYIRAAWDTDRFNKHINFTNLPQKCTIRIFTVSGILIQTINHDENKGDPAGYHSWTLRNKENLDIASGLYIYHVKDEKTGKEKIAKFAVVL